MPDLPLIPRRDAQCLLPVVQAALAGTPAPAVTLPARCAGLRLLHLTLRRRGKRLDSRWAQGADLADALRHGLTQARSALAAQGLPAPETLELTLPRDWQVLDPEDLRRSRCNAIRGLFGLELRGGGRLERIGPLEMIARNLGPNRALEQLSAQLDLPPGTPVEAFRFAADQILFELPQARARPLLRGQPVVPQSAITRAKVAEMAALMTGWMVQAVRPDGATVYKYWPSSGQYSQANNMIRQFMGSACLAQAAQRAPQDLALQNACARNFAYNFRAFYQDEGDVGIIDEFGKVKLGAAAVAVMAILNRADPAPFAREASRLQQFLLQMQRPDGSFRTFLRPAVRDDCQNFYPGEALLALMRCHDHSGDATLLPHVTAGFHHYRDWHRQQRNPAFVPWHAMALCRYHAATGDSAAADFVFEICDWLLGMQQGSTAPADVQGEFFDPARPGFGPPHASATGVYLEGLIEAFALADRLGDAPRRTAYRRAILAGLRALRQMQFRHASDMWYIARRPAVLGGLRSSGFDNTLRIDNVQHGLMAIHRILDLFHDDDFLF